ncbi:transglutaminase-like cysteine peptidase [Caulobacter sp.]|uniref:transglutaminase-like cysteine peptidase n=1 Tax=Caulobacter sp. TaxID=78 RepID=UPI003BAFB9B4
MPLGEGAAPPPGFVDLCQRDESVCVSSAAAPVMALAASTGVLTTSSVGGDPQSIARLQTDATENPAPLQVEQVQIFTPAIDPTFMSSGVVGGAALPTAESAPPVTLAETAAPSELAKPVFLNKSQMRLVNTLNRDVNREVQKANDFDLYGLLEFWSLPRVIDGKMYGDCEDYALEKRRRLIAAGVPAEAMSMAVAVTARGETHAVLLVRFESGDWVLDNLTPWATPWGDLNYRWIERQAPGSPEWKKVA